MTTRNVKQQLGTLTVFAETAAYSYGWECGFVIAAFLTEGRSSDAYWQARRRRGATGYAFRHVKGVLKANVSHFRYGLKCALECNHIPSAELRAKAAMPL